MIQFTNPINLDKLRMAFNNDIAEFSSSSNLPALYADVGVGNRLYRLYPNPDNKFYFNFKPYVSALINTRNFEDTLQPSISGGFPAEYIYNFTAGSYLQSNVSFTIRLSNNTIDTASYSLAWLAGVQQLGDNPSFQKTDSLLLSPFHKNTYNHYYLKYWQGYPFDISLYSPAGTVTLHNETTLLQQAFDVPGKVSRLVFSDGRTDETLETLFPLAEGYNKIKITSSGQQPEGQKFLTLEKIPYQCGVYLKWLNQYGGYSYWLFEDTYTIDRSTKQLGELDRDLYNLENSFGRSMQIGKESQDSIRVIAELLTPDESLLVQSLLDSPKIYLFTGKPFAQNGKHSWIEVALKTGNSRIKNAKQNLANFSFELELPQRYTQTL